MNKTEKHIVENTLRKLAERDGISMQDVRSNIQDAMISGLMSRDPEVQKYWRRIPCENGVLTPEDLILFLVKQVKKQCKT